MVVTAQAQGQDAGPRGRGIGTSARQRDTVSATAASLGSVDTTGTRLGLAHLSAVGVYGGGVALRRGSAGGNVGLLVDLGQVQTPRIRLWGDIGFLFVPHREYVDDEVGELSSVIYDLSGTLSLVATGAPALSRFVPHAAVGVSLHALSSSFGTTVLDQRYNANRWGLDVAVGFRIRPGGGDRTRLLMEGRRTWAGDAHRWEGRIGVMRDLR